MFRFHARIHLWSAACCAILALPAVAQDYPAKPIRLLSSSSAGGAGDGVARLLAPSLGKRLGGTVVVENRGGAGGLAAVEGLVRAAPDGHTLLMTTNSIILPSAAKPPYDVAKDLLPIAKVTQLPSVFAVGAHVPVNTMKEFIALAKARPGKLTFSSTGVGTQTHLNGELLKFRAGIDIVHIPYKASATAVMDLVAGRIDLIPTAASQVSAHAKSGALKILAVCSTLRSGALPDVPTMIESGFPDYVSGSWFGFFAPAGTPGDIVRRLAKELAQIAQSDEFVEQMAKIGGEKSVSVMEEFGREVLAEAKVMAALVKQANIKLE